MYAYYSGESSSHLVVITGVNVTKNIVYTNNPWGIKGEQSFDEFLHGFATDGPIFDSYELKRIYRIKRN
ncbi:MAG: hypothetical protein IKG32_08385 [Clostridia bacterium]|nr:hypothetical protein [Clostridia bacterium]